MTSEEFLATLAPSLLECRAMARETQEEGNWRAGRIALVAVVLVAVSLVAWWLLGRSRTSEPVAPPLAVETAPELRQVTNWGPQTTKPDTPFNVQPNGDSAFWIVGAGEPDVTVVLGNQELQTFVANNLVSANVPTSLLHELMAKPRVLELHLVNAKLGARQKVGDFVVAW